MRYSRVGALAHGNHHTRLRRTVTFRIGGCPPLTHRAVLAAWELCHILRMGELVPANERNDPVLIEGGRGEEERERREKERKKSEIEKGKGREGGERKKRERE